MTFFVSRLSVSEATTIINAVVTFVQFSLSLSFVVVLVKVMPRSNVALSWSTITRTMNSTIWPILLRMDAKPAGGAVVMISWLTLLTTLLVAFAGVTLPLGLSTGSLQHGPVGTVRAVYLGDTSPLALATTPHRDQYSYGRICGAIYMQDIQFCPTAGDDPNVYQPTSLQEIAPSLLEIFNSTHHGPFSMQSRLFSKFSEDQNLTVGSFATPESFILKDGTFLAEGVVIDMSPERPGVGFLNHTLPEGMDRGGVWSEDVLWLEPVTTCVKTNLTVDYVMDGLPGTPIQRFNLTDRGGFTDIVKGVGAPSPFYDIRSQADINLAERAYRAAVYSNYVAMVNLSIVPDTVTLGQAHPLNNETGGYLGRGIIGQVSFVPLDYIDLAGTSRVVLENICSGYSPADKTNLTNISIHCGVFLGSPIRVDGGDPQFPVPGSRWTQELRTCASASRASIQRIEFSTNDTQKLQNIQVSRQGNQTVLWGLEWANMSIAYFDPFWARVDDRYETDNRIWTVRSDGFYLPAGENTFSANLAYPTMGNPSAAHAIIWGTMYSNFTYKEQGLADYSAQSNLPLKDKFRDLVEDDPDQGHAQIRNLIWTDLMANSIIGSQKASTLVAAPNLTSLQYDFRFATPGFVLLLIWIPAFFMVVFLFFAKLLTFEHVRRVLNTTSVGRVVVGSSGLQVIEKFSEDPSSGVAGKDPQDAAVSNSIDHENGGRGASDWVIAGGRQIVVLDLSHN